MRTSTISLFTILGIITVNTMACGGLELPGNGFESTSQPLTEFADLEYDWPTNTIDLAAIKADPADARAVDQFSISPTLRDTVNNALRLEKNQIMAAHLLGRTDGSGFTLNRGDERQRDFIKRRLAWVGKNQTNSPALFKRLMSKVPSKVSTQELDCSQPLSVHQDAQDPTKWTAKISTSCFDGTDHSYVDLFWWNTDDGEIIAYDYREEFSNGTDLTLTIYADESLIGTVIQVDSMAISSRGPEDYYGIGQVLQERPNVLMRLDNIFDPSDQNQDNRVTVCLDRSGSDCDYYFSGTRGHIMLPINVSFRFPGVITQVLKATAQVHMTNTGGVCSTQDFSRYAKATGGMVQVNTNGPVDFGEKCVANQVDVRFWIHIIAKNSRGVVYQVFWANDFADHPIQFPVRFKWSCLAEGSLVDLADGQKKMIENVKRGDRIASKGQILTVVDITSGTESAPMVRLHTADGSNLLATQGHPFVGTKGELLRADELKAGDQIETYRGLTSIKRIDREHFSGRVYNLKLGTKQEIANLGTQPSSMYANGLRVGDERTQWALTVKRQKEEAVASLPPSDWFVDYVHHTFISWIK